MDLNKRILSLHFRALLVFSSLAFPSPFFFAVKMQSIDAFVTFVFETKFPYKPPENTDCFCGALSKARVCLGQSRKQ